MLQIISWKQYIIYSTLALIVYYGCIIFKFYRKDLLYLKFPKAIRKKGNTSSQETLFTGRVPVAPAETAKNLLSASVHDFIDELKMILKLLAAQQSGKIEIMNAVSNLLQKYASLKGSSFQTAISNLIASESEANCNISLNADELASLWN